MSKTRRLRPSPQDRPRQNVPAEIVQDLMSVIRNQFYPDTLCAGSGKQWFQDQQFLKVRVVLWPAAWLTSRGVTLKPERYKQILFDIFNAIKRHGATDAVKYWPGYLAKCVQDHFRHHEDEIYYEAKALRSQVERALATAQTAVASHPDPIARLAEIQHLLISTTRKRHCKPAAGQLKLL